MLAILFVVFAVGFRFLPHPLAFTPVAAALLYFGARMPRKYAWIAVGLLAASDVVLTKVVYGYALPADTFITWAWYIAIVLFGGVLAVNAKPWRVLGAALGASVSFFFISNFGVWAAWPTYPKTLSGLTASYVAGLPFFRNDLAGDLFFTAVFFGIGHLVQVLAERRAHVAA
ncbi:MAG TPA: DUF6580 family putative transport protein [Terriglobales bacterium]|nr:DUF6580 family putative transport protein [Terriglobales bacterium]